jgi:hydroxymethylpyrimidine kinase / phosphomethylpyrimidine kinase / thiamine-phosphate diphosphorylase
MPIAAIFTLRGEGIMKRALTIAGSDSGGGAGIQGDIKTFTVSGVYGMSAITAVTAQNSVGVQGIVTMEADFVAMQIESVLTDIGVDAAKTGMLANEEIVHVVADRISYYGIKNLVVDPVMVAKGGDHLLQRNAVEALKKKLLPVSLVVTPNLEEAAVIVGKDLLTQGDIEDAARRIFDFGTPYVVIKGGHGQGDAVDILYDGETIHSFSAPRYETKNTHGTGCTFSAAITAALAHGKDVYSAVADAKAFISTAIRYSLNLGTGHGPTNHLAMMEKRVSRYEVLENIRKALKRLETMKIGHLIPETQTNLAMAMPYADSPDDVAAVPGRIIRWGDTIRTLSEPLYGASHSMASMVLTARKSDPAVGAAMNIRYSEETLAACHKAGFAMVEFTWPLPGEKREGHKLSDLVSGYVRLNGSAPDIVFNRGGWGKEAHIEFFGKDALDIAEKIKRVIENTQ